MLFGQLAIANVSGGVLVEFGIGENDKTKGVQFE
jgi:hypothetical protein